MLKRKSQIQQARNSFTGIQEHNPGHREPPEPSAGTGTLSCNLANAIKKYTRLLQKQPNHVHHMIDLAHILFQQNKLTRAAQQLETAITIEPDNGMAYSNLGYMYYLMGESTRAEALCRRAVHLAPAFADAYCNLAVVLISLQQYDEAGAILKKALHLTPDSALLWNNMAIVLLQSGKVSDAIRASRKAIQLNPASADALCNLGMALQETMETERALIAYQQALDIQPLHSAARSNFLMCLQYAPQKSSAELRNSAIRLGSNQAHTLSPGPTATQDTKRLHIGYVSGDFYQHPVGCFFLPVLKYHNRSHVTVSCYDTADRNDELTKRLRANSDHWHRLHNMTDTDAASKIRDDQVDILVDLAGHTAGNRLGIFQLKPAPIQVSWLGYFASTGLEAMDYVFLGKDQAPTGTEAFFSEKLLRLNHCQFLYTPPPYCPPVSLSPHINSKSITFGCFNNTAKLNPDVLTLWANLLMKIPESRLLLKWKSFADPLFRKKIRAFFKGQGVAEQRIEFRGASGHQSMLEEYGDVDIALDPFPFSGALTTSEAMWMGVPVITLAGLRPVSRQSAAILIALGMSDLVAQTPEEYLRIAENLVADTGKRDYLRNTLRKNMEKMFSHGKKNLTRSLEQAFFRVQSNALKCRCGGLHL